MGSNRDIFDRGRMPSVRSSVPGYRHRPKDEILCRNHRMRRERDDCDTKVASPSTRAEPEVQSEDWPPWLLDRKLQLLQHRSKSPKRVGSAERSRDPVPKTMSRHKGLGSVLHEIPGACGVFAARQPCASVWLMGKPYECGDCKFNSGYHVRHIYSIIDKVEAVRQRSGDTSTVSEDLWGLEMYRAIGEDIVSSKVPEREMQSSYNNFGLDRLRKHNARRDQERGDNITSTFERDFREFQERIRCVLHDVNALLEKIYGNRRRVRWNPNDGACLHWENDDV